MPRRGTLSQAASVHDIENEHARAANRCPPTTPRARLFGIAVSTVGNRLHFACGFRRGGELKRSASCSCDGKALVNR